MALNYKTRYEILKRDHYMCPYCGGRPPAVELQVDHAISRANGGTDHPSNLITACVPCNQGKKAGNVASCRFCVRPLCRGPQDPRDALESGCGCTCHMCVRCMSARCPGAQLGGICTDPATTVHEEEMFHDVSVEEGFTF